MTKTKDEKLLNVLTEVCDKLKIELEKDTAEPAGVCYLIGHCLAEGLSKAGFKAKEVTGHLIVKDKSEKNIVYGTAKYKGKLLGYYHTWCVIDDEIIVDPSMGYNKAFLRKHGIKLHTNIPDTIIDKNDSNWLYEFIPDEKLISQSKHFLKKIPSGFVKQLINTVNTVAINCKMLGYE